MPPHLSRRPTMHAAHILEYYRRKLAREILFSGWHSEYAWWLAHYYRIVP